MSAIRCHFDGKVFVPDEPVNAIKGEIAEVRLGQPEVEFTGGPGGMMGDLLKTEAIGGWNGIFDRNMDSAQAADELRRRANMPSYDKQRAFIDLHEYWDEQRRKQNPQEPGSGSS
jgi:hypothetical protein